jgi:hypothetical protein
MLYNFNVFKYHVSCTDGKISVRIKIEITFIFRFHCHPIQLIVFVPVGLLSAGLVGCQSFFCHPACQQCYNNNKRPTGTDITN